MEIITFNLVGKFAHFKKYFSNSTALTYSLPPRTTVIGIIAAIMGYQRDTYYEDLSRNKLYIAIGIKNSLKKSFHRVNNLMIKGRSWDDFMGKKKHTQSPFEILTPENLNDGEIVYKIFLHAVEPIFRNELKQKLIDKKHVYNISFGVAQFSASINNISIIEGTEENSVNEIISFDSAVSSNCISKLCFSNKNDFNFVEEDLIPVDFYGNKNRELKDLRRVLYTFNNIGLIVQFTGDYCKLTDNRNIQFI
jgi:CRISPR-associated protein Cas5h